MRKFDSIATLRGDGLRPELRALFDRLAIDPRPVFFVRDGMVQAGPDPASETAPTNVVPLRDRPANDGRPRRRKMGSQGTRDNDVAPPTLDHVRQHFVHILHDKAHIQVQHPVDSPCVGVTESPQK